MAVNGNWGSWDTWNNCSHTCGGGVRSRTRLCNDPKPKNGGAACASNAKIGIDYMKRSIREQLSKEACNETPCKRR